MRIVLVTAADRLADVAARRLLEDESGHEVIAVVQTTAPLQRIWSVARAAMRHRSFYYFLYMAAEGMLRPKAMLRPVNRPRVETPSIIEHVRRRGLPLTTTANVNDPEVVRFIRNAAPDAVLSIRPGQIFRMRFIREVPPILNLHCTELPKYRGMGGILQAMAAGEVGLGTSFHGIVSEAVDAGPLYAQTVIPDMPGTSLFFQTCRLYAAAADILPDGLEALREGRTISYDEADATLHSWPGPEPRRGLRHRNRSFIAWSDLR